MVTVVITSCNRLDLLRRTTESFLKFNTYPISEYIIIDDSGNRQAHDEIKRLYPDWTLILDPLNRGQVNCIDDAYSRVKTPYIFHCEDDWEFLRHGFIEKSLVILEENPNILITWLRPRVGLYGTVDPEIFNSRGIEYQLIGSYDGWHGFTWNPGLRRVSDYRKVAPFSSFIHEGDFNAQTERRIGQEFYNMGFRAAILNEAYCSHIG